MSRRLWSTSLVWVVVALLVALLPWSAAAAEEPEPAPPPTPTVLTVSGPASAPVGTAATLQAVLTEEAGGPVADAPVQVQQRSAEVDPATGQRVWEQVGAATTDGAGAATHAFTVAAGTARLRVVYAGSPTHGAATSPVLVVTGTRIGTTLRLSGPSRVVDETAVSLALRWRAADDRPVTGDVVVSWRKKGTDRWRRHGVVRVRRGAGELTARPRVDTVWRAVGRAGEWFAGDTSNRHRVDNVPPGTPVSLPAGAPAPRRSTPVQQRAVGSGLNASVTRIPAGVWRSMVGRSWRSGCPVGRASLRLVRMNYWGFNGYRYRGELVVHTAITAKTVAVFRDLYAGGFPIRRMYRVDRFGYSSRLRGANDYASMAADNTSAFNCRSVVGRPGVRSPHAYGRSIDLNPWENPYASAQDGWVPDAWWVSRSHPRVAWRSSSHPVVEIFRRNGFRWTYGTRDSHHFDG